MSARAWKRRRAKALLRDPAVRQWFEDCGDKIARELAERRGNLPQFPWGISLHGLPVYASKEPKP